MPPTRRPQSPILVAVDRSGSRAGLEYAASESLRSGRPLQILHVAPTGGGWYAQVGRDALRVAVDHAEAVLAGRSTTSGRLARGSVIPELVAHAADAALLVMERGATSQRRVPTTRTTSAVAATVDTPVVVVPRDWVDPGRRVVTLGLQPEAVDVHAVRAALALARLRGAVLRVVVSGDTPRAGVLELLDRMGSDACDLALEVVTEPPRTALAVASRGSDLLVLGRRRPARPEGSRLGPVSAAALDDLTCPLLLTAPGHLDGSSGTGPATPRIQEAIACRT